MQKVHPFTDFCPTLNIQQIVSDENGSEKNKMCIEITLSNAKVRTQPSTKYYRRYLHKIRLKLSFDCRLFGAN